MKKPNMTIDNNVGFDAKNIRLHKALPKSRLLSNWAAKGGAMADDNRPTYNHCPTTDCKTNQCSI